jgi:hypothetical protein
VPARVSLPHMHSDDRWPILKSQCPCIFTLQNSLYRGLLRIEACRTCIPMILAEILKSQPTCISTIKSHYKERHLRMRCTGCRIPIILRVAVSWWKSQGLGRKTDTYSSIYVSVLRPNKFMCQFCVPNLCQFYVPHSCVSFTSQYCGWQWVDERAKEWDVKLTRKMKT